MLRVEDLGLEVEGLGLEVGFGVEVWVLGSGI